MRRLLAAALCLALLPPLAAAGVLLLVPGWALNSRVAAWVLRELGAAYSPRWESLELSVSGTGLSKRLELRAADLCADGPLLSGCLPELRLDAGLRLGLSPPLRVRRVEALVLRAGPLAVRRSSAPASEPEGGAGAPSFLRGTTLGLLELEVSSAAFVSPEGATPLRLAARYSEAAGGPLTAEGLVGGTSFTLSLESDLWRGGGLSYLEGDARLRGAVTADLRARLEPRPGGGTFSADAAARAGARRLKAALSGSLEGRTLSAKGSAEARDPKGPLRRAALTGCGLRAELPRGGGLRLGELSCRAALEPAPFGAGPKDRLKGLSGPVSVRVGPQGRVLAARLGPAGGGRTLVSLDGRASEDSLSLDLSVARFQDLAAYFGGTRFAIPAPFNVLAGSVTASVRRAGSALEYRARTRLSSRLQRLNASAEGSARLGAGALEGAETRLRLEDVALQLPPLELGPAPRMTLDKRIVKGDAQPERRTEGPPFDHRLLVTTEKPVLLLSDALPEPVPVSLDLVAAPAGLSGEIRIEAFRLEVFRRQGRVRHLTLTPAGPGEPLGLDGLIITERAGTTVRISLAGTTKSPQVSFQSDPPMERAEIVGLLLYGRPPSELAGDEQASAGNASAAFAEGAFGLASLYLFAATPIETVGYDPATQSYKVRFKLPAGTTLAVGSDLEENRTLTFRKRLGRRFEVETEVATAAEEDNEVTTFLQWFMRY